MLEAELRELLDAIVRQIKNRQDQHVDLAGDQRGLRLVRRVRHIPVLDRLGAADGAFPEEDLVWISARLCDLGQDRLDPIEQAVVADEDRLALGDGGGARRLSRG